MKLEMTNITVMRAILHGYSDRRLQYAIKLGIMPTPERLSIILKRISNAERALTARPLETRLMERLASKETASREMAKLSSNFS